MCAFFGAVVGFALTGSFQQAVPYIAAMALILAVRLITGGKKGRVFVIINALVSGVGIFGANLPSAETPSDIFTAFAFGAIVIASVLCADSFTRAKDKPVTISGAAGQSGAAGVRKNLSALLEAMSMRLIGGMGSGVVLDAEAFQSGLLRLSAEDTAAIQAQADTLMDIIQ